jgi:hypothetical protein
MLTDDDPRSVPLGELSPGDVFRSPKTKTVYMVIDTGAGGPNVVDLGTGLLFSHEQNGPVDFFPAARLVIP